MRTKLGYLISFLFVSAVVYGASQSNIPTDVLKLGRPTAADKSLTFDLNLGGSNPKITARTADGKIEIPALDDVKVGMFNSEASTVDQIIASDGAGNAAWVTPSSSFTVLLRNLLDNGEFRFFQRQTPGTLTTRSDSAVGPDRWRLLTSHTTNVQSARVTEVISASPTSFVMQLRQADGTARQIGTVQHVRQEHTLPVRGQIATFGFYARTDGTEITTIRACLAEWTGTANTPPADPVSSWGATPTWVANFTCLNTPADITISSSWSQHSVSGTVGSSATGLAVVVWTPNTEAQNDDLYLAQAQLIRSDAVLPWYKVQKSYEEDLRNCKHYYNKAYDTDTAPGTGGTPNGIAIDGGQVANGTYGGVGLSIPTMFKTPTVTFYDANGSSNSMIIYNTATFAQTNGVGIAGSLVSQNYIFVRFSNSSGSPLLGAVYWTADAEL